MADNFDLPFFEVSCKDNINIENAFLTLSRKIRELRELKGDPFQETKEETEVLKNKLDSNAKSCNC